MTVESSGFFLHYSGVLVPLGTKPCAAYGDWSWCEQYVIDPVAAPCYVTPVLDAGITAQIRVYYHAVATPGPGVSGTAGLSFLLDSWTDGEIDPEVFTPFSNGYVTARFVRGQLVMDTSVPAYLSSLSLIVDAPIVTTPVQGFAVAAGGTVLSYASVGAGPFHQFPAVLVTPTSPGTVSGSATQETTTSCLIQLFDKQGDSVAGTCNLSMAGN